MFPKRESFVYARKVDKILCSRPWVDKVKHLGSIGQQIATQGSIVFRSPTKDFLMAQIATLNSATEHLFLSLKGFEFLLRVQLPREGSSYRVLQIRHWEPSEKVRGGGKEDEQESRMGLDAKQESLFPNSASCVLLCGRNCSSNTVGLLCSHSWTQSYGWLVNLMKGGETLPFSQGWAAWHRTLPSFILDCMQHG